MSMRRGCQPARASSSHDRTSHDVIGAGRVLCFVGQHVACTVAVSERRLSRPALYTYAPQVLHAFGKLGSGSMLARSSKRVSERIRAAMGGSSADS